jgi:hypothetical protein
LPHRRFRLRGSFVVVSLATILLPSAAHGFVAAPVGGHPGEIDANLRVGFERGKVEPNENQASWQKAQWEIYQVGLGYTVGNVGPLQDFYFRVDNTFFRSPAETNAPDRLVNPDAAPPAVCLGRVLEDGVCEFHPSDSGWLLSPTVGFNFVHEATHSFGMFVTGTIPIGVNLSRFTLPKIDYVAGGTQLGVHITSWLGYASRIHLGTGAFGGDHTQNATVALTNLLFLEAKRWILPWKVGISLGPYFEGDLTERFDDVYDAAYTPAYDEGNRDRIRSVKFALVLAPYFQITEHAAIEAGYVQKFFGYDAPATQLWFGGARFAYDVVD